MECEIIRNGSIERRGAARGGAVKRKLVSGGVGGVRGLGLAGGRAAVAADRPALSAVAGAGQPRPTTQDSTHTEPPFMNNMDEISYWIISKRAPCLMNYDILNKKTVPPSDVKVENVPSSHGDSTPTKRKKAKLAILDEWSWDGKQHNKYFDPQPVHKPAPSSSKSSTLVSDIDFNIKNSSIQEKTKRSKSQKNNLTTLHKKNKLVTSTPKVNNVLRRSLRRQNSINNNSPAKMSYQTNYVYLSNEKPNCTENIQKANHDTGNKAVCNLNNKFVNNETNPKPVLNGQFEDMSDVSGFTANYIRSTKIQNTKTPRNVRSKNSKNLVKESQQNSKTDNDKMIVCVSKAMNTKDPTKTTVLNCSTDSSQNILNLITVHENEKATRLSKSTSLLKFIDSKPIRNKSSKTLKQTSNSKNNSNLDTSFNSNCTSRYPKRYKNGSRGDITNDNSTLYIQTPSKGKQRVYKQPSMILNLDMKEDPECSLSRTRSGRSIGIALHRPVDSVLVLSPSTEPSSKPTMNVASDIDNGTRKKRNSGVRCKKSVDKNGDSLRHDSLRDRSGFAACFSDVEDSDEPVKTRKFFR